MTEDEIALLQKRVRIAEESKARAWANAGILERARQAQDKTIADLRAQLAAWTDASQCGHPNPCTLGSLCPYCEIGRLRAQVEAGRIMADFAKGAILDAIGTEDGLDGEDGQAVMCIITEWQEHGTFDKTKCDHMTSFEKHASQAIDEDAAAEIEALQRQLADCRAEIEALRSKEGKGE